MLAVPDARFGLGVNVAVLRVPVPLRLPNVPPLTLTSPAFEAHVKLLPGSSLKVKVMVAVSPVFKVAVLEVMAKLGAVVSTKYLTLSATATEVMVASLPLASLMVELFRLSALIAMATPVLSFCP
jgi:hypothetical protein